MGRKIERENVKTKERQIQVKHFWFSKYSMCFGGVGGGVEGVFQEGNTVLDEGENKKREREKTRQTNQSITSIICRSIDTTVCLIHKHLLVMPLRQNKKKVSVTNTLIEI